MLGSNEKSIPLFIAMPYCNCVFENIAPTIYQSVAHHFRHVGYTLVSRQENGYTLQITIKNLSPIINFVSPDVLLFHLTMRLELVCELYNFAKKCIQQKTFFFYTLLSKPRNPIINGSFLEYEYKKLIDRSVPKIEQYFRPYLLKTY